MRTSSLRLFAALLVLAVFGSVQHSAQAQSTQATQVFDRLKAKYDAIGTLRASFTQTMTSEYSDDVASSRGTLVLQGERYRVETAAQTLVTDGEVTWIYVPAENQLLINDQAQDESTFSINDFFFDYDRRYNLSKVTQQTLDGQKHFVLSLVPKNADAFFRTVTLSMRDRDDVITRLEIVDMNGTTMRFKLTDIQLNPKVDAKTFTFEPPAGVEVVDLRS